MYGLNKYMIDINIETLAGTTFSLKVSPLEPIHSVKAKIQRLEGIPISHQHLVWKTTELEDTCCLNDYNIPNGATIKMVLALRGGPINTRRMTTEDSLLRDVSDLMEIREDSNLWNNNDSSQSINKHVTLLLFRDGDHLNLLRVIDRGDAASPISGAMSAASMYVPYDETDHERLLTNNASNTAPDGTLIESDIKMNSKKIKYKKSLTYENEKTREKMIALRDKMNECKKQKTRNKLSNEQQQVTSTDSLNPTTINTTITTTIKPQLVNKQPESILTTKQETDQTETELKQDTNQLVTQQQSHSAKINSTNQNRNLSNNLRMKRLQIIGDSSKLLPPNEAINKKLSSSATIQNNELINKEDKSVSTKQLQQQAKTKLTTIYTTTDRNGQVFIKKIHENFTELTGDDMADDEPDDDEPEDEDLESDEDLEDEYDENYDEECVDYETNLLKNYNCYYDDEYFVDDGEVDYDDVDVDDDEDEDEDDEDDDVDDDLDDDDDDEDDELDDELDDEDDVECETKLKTAKSEYDENAPIMGEDDYDEDENENELLLNKSELLINEDRQTNNSPNSGGINETSTTGVNSGNNGNAELMTMMMMMTLNSDQLSLNGGATSGIGIHGGISSSLATTALPTILTPMYHTDNENFHHHPSTRSAMKKLKNIRISNKKAQSISNQLKIGKNKRNKQLINPILLLETNNLKVNTNQSPKIKRDSVNESSNPDLEKLKQIETLVQEERLAAARLQKQKRKKRRIQLQLQQLKDEEVQNKLSQESNTNQQQPQPPNETDNVRFNQMATNQQHRINPRRRKRRDYSDPKPNIQFSSILLLPEEIESIKRRMKEQQQQQQLSRQSRNQTSLKLNQDKEKSNLVEPDKSQIVNDSTTETKSVSLPQKTNLDEEISTNVNLNTNFNDKLESNQQQQPIQPPMPSQLQKRVSFIVTPTDEDKTNQQSVLSNDYLDKMKKILKTSPNIASTGKSSSLQAKVFSDLQTTTLPSQQIKPLLLTNYKQKPPPKLDSLYSSNEIVTFSNVNNKLYQQQPQPQPPPPQQQLDDNTSKMFANLTNKSYPNESDLLRNSERIPTQTNINLLKRNSAVIRNISTPTSSPAATTSTSINRVDILKNNLTYSNNSVLKNYSSNYGNNTNIMTNKYNETTSVEPLRLSSASARANKTVSMSNNDLSTKALKLPVITNTNAANSSNSIIIGGSTNNITSIGLNESTTGKKKITDLSRYCFFCQRKTGLASSYICRCGNNYCTQHRNAEAHSCTYDYKTEGRKLIEHSNPLVAAPKLPKI